MPVREVTAEELKNLNNEGITLLQFYAEWCGPCKMLTGEINKIIEENEALNIVRYDIDQDINLAREYGIRGVPALFLLRNEEILDLKSGFFPKKNIEEWMHSQLEWEGR